MHCSNDRQTVEQGSQHDVQGPIEDQVSHSYLRHRHAILVKELNALKCPAGFCNHSIVGRTC